MDTRISVFIYMFVSCSVMSDSCDPVYWSAQGSFIYLLKMIK